MSQKMLSLWIDRAIVVAQFDLSMILSPKKFDRAVNRFLHMANLGKENSETSLLLICDEYEKKAISLIISGIIEKNFSLLKEINEGKWNDSVLIRPLDENNRWGDEIISLAEELGLKINYN